MLSGRILMNAALLSCVSLQALTPGKTHNSSLTGSLQGDDDSSIQGHIMAYRIEARHGRMMPSPECSTDTDAQGNFQCVHLESGSYILIASALRWPFTSVHDQSKSTAPSPIPLFATYPANTDLDAANLVQLGSRETQSLEVQVHGDAGSDLNVTSAAGKSKDKALQVSLMGEDFAVSANVRIAADRKDGNYNIKGLPAGAYKLTELWSDNGVTHQGSAFISAGQLAFGQAAITEIKPYTVTGSIRYPDSAAHGTVNVVLKSTATYDSHRYTATVQANGTFSLTGVLSGKYYISFDPESGLYIADVLVSDHSAGGAVLTVDDGHSITPLTLVASPASGSIAGTLKLSDNEQHGANIVVESLTSHTSQLVPVDSQGAFKVDKLAPGEYILYGWTDVRDVPYDSSSFLRRYENKAVHIELQNGTLASGVEIECNKAGS